MMIKIPVTLVIAVFAMNTCCVAVQAQNNIIVFPKSGYSIAAHDPGLSENGSFETLKITLPPKDGFRSNVNVQHQAFSGTLKEFSEMSELQLEKSGLKVFNGSVTDSFYGCEAEGEFANTRYNLHFYFRALKSGDNVILATATSLTSRWETEKLILKPLVDSLSKLEK